MKLKEKEKGPRTATAEERERLPELFDWSENEDSSDDVSNNNESNEDVDMKNEETDNDSCSEDGDSE